MSCRGSRKEVEGRQSLRRLPKPRGTFALYTHDQEIFLASTTVTFIAPQPCILRHYIRFLAAAFQLCFRRILSCCATTDAGCILTNPHVTTAFPLNFVILSHIFVTACLSEKWFTLLVSFQFQGTDVDRSSQRKKGGENCDRICFENSRCPATGVCSFSAFRKLA